MNFLSFFKRNNELDSFIALKYNIPTESATRGAVEAWIFTLPSIVVTNAQAELYKRGILATPPDTSHEHKDREFVLVNLAVGLAGTKPVLDIIKKHLRNYEA